MTMEMCLKLIDRCKVILLFFIDKADKYRGECGVQNLKSGIYARISVNLFALCCFATHDVVYVSEKCENDASSFYHRDSEKKNVYVIGKTLY